MPTKTNARLRQLLADLDKAQKDYDGLTQQTRVEIAGLMSGGDVRPVGTSGDGRKKKAGRKKR